MATQAEIDAQTAWLLKLRTDFAKELQLLGEAAMKRSGSDEYYKREIFAAEQVLKFMTTGIAPTDTTPSWGSALLADGSLIGNVRPEGIEAQTPEAAQALLTQFELLGVIDPLVTVNGEKQILETSNQLNTEETVFEVAQTEELPSQLPETKEAVIIEDTKPQGSSVAPKPLIDEKLKMNLIGFGLLFGIVSGSLALIMYLTKDKKKDAK